MGEIAEMMINGDMDCITGEWLGNGYGCPRTTTKGASKKTKKRRQQRKRAKAKNKLTVVA